MTPGSQTQYVHWFRRAAPYINKHRDQIFVVQIGSELIASDNFTGLIHDLVTLQALGIRLVLVHGTRAHISASMTAGGAAPQFVGGRRITDEHSLHHVKQVAGSVRLDIEARLSMGIANSPMAGAQVRVVSGNFVTARPIGVRNGVDFCWTGEVRRVDAQSLRHSLDSQAMALLSPLGFSPTGEVFNLRSDEVATAVAIALGANKLILLGDSDQPGSDQLQPDDLGPSDPDVKQLSRQLTLTEARSKLAQWRHTSAQDEMSEQLASAVHACNNHVPRTHLIDWHIDGGLLLELFTRDGVGTMVSADAYDAKRTATVDDVAGILALIEPLEADGILVRRSRDKLEREIDRFTVMERDGAIVACAALYPFANANAVELACLAVHPQYRNGERGDLLLEDLEARARAGGANLLFVLTTHTAQWFMERGFIPWALDSLPVERQVLYNFQRNSRVLGKTLA
jgi:amino-acid N-acetyltransferase